jgi:glycosyltransferase involved in cell wall biosynthesis
VTRISLLERSTGRTGQRLRLLFGSSRFGPRRARLAPLRLLLCTTRPDLPTAQINFLRPMQPWVEAGALGLWQATDRSVPRDSPGNWLGWIVDYLAPHAVLVCRDFAAASDILRLARAKGVPLIYHIDDDMTQEPPRASWDELKRPRSMGQLDRVGRYLEGADLVYFSNDRLATHLGSRVGKRSVTAGIPAAAVTRPAARTRPYAAMKFGYMGGSSHSADLAVAAEGIQALMAARPDISFEIFGQIALPPLLAQSRIVRHQAHGDYAAFLDRLNTLGWDFAIAPLASHPFNECKSEVKWVEYAGAGIPALYSDCAVYRNCAGDGAGLLVADDGWSAALRRMADDVPLRHEIATAASEKVARFYTSQRMRGQLRALFLEAGVANAERLVP